MQAGKGGAKGYGKDGGKGAWQAYNSGSSGHKQGGKGCKGKGGNDEKERQRAIKAKQVQQQVDWMAPSSTPRRIPYGTSSPSGPTVGRGRALLRPVGQADQCAHSMPGIPEGGNEGSSPHSVGQRLNEGFEESGPYPSNSGAAMLGDDPLMTEDPWGGHFQFNSIQVAHSATMQESYSTECGAGMSDEQWKTHDSWTGVECYNAPQSLEDLTSDSRDNSYSAECAPVKSEVDPWINDDPWMNNNPSVKNNEQGDPWAKKAPQPAVTSAKSADRWGKRHPEEFAADWTKRYPDEGWQAYPIDSTGGSWGSYAEPVTKGDSWGSPYPAGDDQKNWYSSDATADISAQGWGYSQEQPETDTTDGVYAQKSATDMVAGSFEARLHRSFRKTAKKGWEFLPCMEGDFVFVLASTVAKHPSAKQHYAYVLKYAQTQWECGWVPVDFLELAEPCEFLVRLPTLVEGQSLGLTYGEVQGSVKGLQVAEIRAGSLLEEWNLGCQKFVQAAATRSQVLPGDWITMVDGKTDADEMKSRLDRFENSPGLGSSLMLRVNRFPTQRPGNGEEHEVTVASILHSV